jgi:hypothetical protein
MASAAAKVALRNEKMGLRGLAEEDGQYSFAVALRQSRRSRDQDDGHARWLPRVRANIWLEAIE